MTALLLTAVDAKLPSGGSPLSSAPSVATASTTNHLLKYYCFNLLIFFATVDLRFSASPSWAITRQWNDDGDAVFRVHERRGDDDVIGHPPWP
jgi:hypothetical protein